MEKSIDLLAREKDDLENRSRRNNLVFYGIEQENDIENWEESEEKVKNVMRQQLGIDKRVEFERVHRLSNAPAVRGWKPIIARFVNFKDRTLTLTSAFKLKDTELSIGEDFSKRLRHIRSILFNF